MKNLTRAEQAANTQIRANRLKMREKLKMNLTLKEKNDCQDELSTTATLNSRKTHSPSKQNPEIDLGKKQIILGAFEDSYELKEKIGEGAHATVYRCVEKISGQVYAVKITKHHDEETLENSKVQFKILKDIHHRNIVQAVSFYVDRKRMTTYLVCELCSYNELGIYLRNRNVNSINQAQATFIITEILKTLQYLHERGICHRDIKPENILYNPQTGQIKVIDFDCSKCKREIDQSLQMWTKTGSLHYQAPQYFQQTIYTEKVDIWAAGIIAYELIAGHLPFKSNYYHRMVKMITQDDLQLEAISASEGFKQMLKKLLEKNPQHRLTAEQCLRLPVLLKMENFQTCLTNDDFEVEMKNPKYDRLARFSCSQINQRKKKCQKSVEQNERSKNQQSNYYYLVNE